MPTVVLAGAPIWLVPTTVRSMGKLQESAHLQEIRFLFCKGLICQLFSFTVNAAEFADVRPPAFFAGRGMADNTVRPGSAWTSICYSWKGNRLSNLRNHCDTSAGAAASYVGNNGGCVQERKPHDNRCMHNPMTKATVRRWLCTDNVSTLERQCGVWATPEVVLQVTAACEPRNRGSHALGVPHNSNMQKFSRWPEGKQKIVNVVIDVNDHLRCSPNSIITCS